jgi:hypothetical protein
MGNTLAGSKMAEKMSVLWKRIKGRLTTDMLGRGHFLTCHFESSDVLTGCDDCGGNYIPRPSWTCVSSY